MTEVQAAMVVERRPIPSVQQDKDEARHAEIAEEENRPALAESPPEQAQGKASPEMMAHFRASVERNWRLGELLAQ